MDDNQWEPDEEFFVKLTLIPGTESELVRLGKTCITEITILNDDGKSLEGPYKNDVTQLCPKLNREQANPLCHSKITVSLKIHKRCHKMTYFPPPYLRDVICECPFSRGDAILNFVKKLTEITSFYLILLIVL